MKIFVLLLCLALLGVAQALRRSDENFFMQHGIKFGGDCQGNKTYGYFADCGERCHKYPIFCQKAKVLRCGCLTGYVQLDSTYLSPCVLPTDCPPKAATYH
ncbi:hypothetical protein HNY73_021461 [Argiope bruennichi]|uniref:Uncharacterized protein n=1 Tax=Argiope bruennichi TaxID=94029 RepID=A0A8T0DZ83_ARGBR|nr:hypothetical protein HNY73_021461 [Argiope bruennichi]